MKKIILTVLAIASTISVMATQTAAVRITLSGSNATYSKSTLKLFEDDARSAAAEDGYDSPCMMTQANSNSTLIYGMIGGDEYSTVSTDDLTGLEIGFVTNNIDNNYTLTFSNFDGNEFYLYDRVLYKSTLINASTPAYAFEAPAGQVAINNRFVIGVPAAYTVTPKGSGYASFSATEATVIPGGVTVYKAEYDGASTLSLTAIDNYIPANTGVIVAGTADVDYYFAVVTDPAAVMPDMSGNNLKPSTAFDGTGEIYCLRHVGSESAFYQYTGATMPANKAFLKLVGGAAAAPKRITMRFNGTTAIDNVEAESVKAEKFVENGQILIRRGNEVFNLQGQIVK